MAPISRLAAHWMLLLSLTYTDGFVVVTSRRLGRGPPFSMAPGGDGESTDKIPQLPAIGSSSFSSRKRKSNEDEKKPFVASRKVQLQYTCNVCDTRNTQPVSRVSFYKGVVIARCKGCDTQHLIADHLGWSGFEEQGVLPRTTSVTEEVFELERILQQHDANTGTIVGEDGMPAME